MVRHGAGRKPHLRGLPPNGDQRRSRRLGAVRLREDAGLPVGHLPGPAGRDRRINFGVNKGQPRGRTCRANIARSLRRIIVTQGDTEPASVEQQRMLGHVLPVAVRPAQHLPGERRGGAPSLGDGLSPAPLLRPRRARGGRGAARAPVRRRGQSAHPRRVQRADAGLAGVLHVHVLHRSRRQVSALVAGRIGLRSAGAHVPLHADRRSAPHVRRRDRRRPHRRSGPPK